MLFQRLRARLQRLGWTVYIVEMIPNDGRVGIDEMARQLALRIDATLAASTPVNLVGFSMGGLVARCYTQTLAQERVVSKLITIAAPHRGTWTAFLRHNAGARQMRPRSVFLRDLNALPACELLRRTEFISIWSPLDLMIIPANSSVMAEAHTIPIRVAAHALMMRSHRVLCAIEAALSPSA